jgi:hypothetical protein
MGATGFNRARRLAAEKANKPIEEVSYQEAINILNQPESEPEESATIVDLTGILKANSPELTREDNL